MAGFIGRSQQHVHWLQNGEKPWLGSHWSGDVCSMGQVFDGNQSRLSSLLLSTRVSPLIPQVPFQMETHLCIG